MQVACGPGLELIYQFLLSDEPGNRRNVLVGAAHRKVGVLGSLTWLPWLPCGKDDLQMAIHARTVWGALGFVVSGGDKYVMGGVYNRHALPVPVMQVLPCCLRLIVCAEPGL